MVNGRVQLVPCAPPVQRAAPPVQRAMEAAKVETGRWYRSDNPMGWPTKLVGAEEARAAWKRIAPTATPEQRERITSAGVAAKKRLEAA